MYCLQEPENVELPYCAEIAGGDDGVNDVGEEGDDDCGGDDVRCGDGAGEVAWEHPCAMVTLERRTHRDCVS